MHIVAQIREQVRALEADRASAMDAENIDKAQIAKFNGQIELLNKQLDAALKEADLQGAATVVSDESTFSFRDLGAKEVVLATSIMAPRNAMSTDATPGSLLVPESWAAAYREARLQGNPLATRIDRVVTESTTNLPYVTDVGSFAETAEGQDYAESDITVEPVVLGAVKATKKVKVTEELADDAGYDVDTMLAKSSGKAAARYEWKKIVATVKAMTPNVTLENKSSITVDDIISMEFKVDEEYRDDMVFILTNATAAHIAKLKDSEGNLIMSSPTDGSPKRIYGHEFFTSAEMAELGTANNVVLALVNPAAIIVADRGPLKAKKMLTEPGENYLFAMRQDFKLAPVDAFAVAKCGSTDPTP